MNKWKEQFLRVWQKIGKRQRYIILGSAVLVFAAILGWSYWWGTRPEYVPLFTNMDAKDAGEVAAKLKEQKIPYEIGGNGTAIMVSSKDVYKVRLDLASQGLPRGNKGFEIFDQTKFGTTEFQNKVNLLQALQGELTKTIEQMDEVEKARVHIVLPEDSLYKKNEKPATASIMLKLRPSAQLSREQIKGIVNLAAHSIQGLKPENITVVDSNAKVLNDPNEGDNVAGPVTLTQIELTKKVQEDLQKNIQTLLDQVLGEGKAAARVNVELNFDKRTTDKQTFEPVVDDKGIVRSSQDSSENYQGTSNGPGGVPGTVSNIPGYVANTGNNSQSTYEKKDSIKNYEINETKEKTISSPGSIRRLTVAVLVDSNIEAAQQDSLLRSVSSAAGINLTRGDTISVESVAFNTELADKQRRDEEEKKFQEKLLFWAKVLLAVLCVAGVAYYIRRRKRLKEEAENMDELANAMLASEDEELIPTAPEETPEERERKKQRENLENLAKTKPDDVAQLLKVWLNDE